MCKRFNAFSRDPYVRAHYFLSRYGSVQALYWALGAGQLITEQVLDVSALILLVVTAYIWVLYRRAQVLLSSGAHLSRYLVQVAVQHYFRSLCPFIKTPWVRTLSLSTFGHFLKLSSGRFGAINIGKGEDDGVVFRNFIRESRRHPDRRGLEIDAIVEILEKGKVRLLMLSKIPYRLSLPAVHSLLLKGGVPAPLAVARSIYAAIIGPNHGAVPPGAIHRTSTSPLSRRKWVPYGWSSAHIVLLLIVSTFNGELLVQYRDFVFRRIFARNQEHGMDDVLLNVRELCRLNTSYAPVVPPPFLSLTRNFRRMFVSRTVAAEVLMEAESNRAGYAALKGLDREGELRFSLAYVHYSLSSDLIECGCISVLTEDLVKVALSRTIYPDIIETWMCFSRLSRRTQLRQHQLQHHFVTCGMIFQALTLSLVSSCF